MTFPLTARLVFLYLVSVDSELLSFPNGNSELLRSTKFHFKTYSSLEMIIKMPLLQAQHLKNIKSPK